MTEKYWAMVEVGCWSGFDAVVQKVAIDKQTAEVFAGRDQSVPQVMTQLPHAGDLSEIVVCN